jgi:hypothetical protein
MKRGLLALLFVALSAGVASAQNPRLRTEPQPAAPDQMSLGQLTPTPSMWFYQQDMENFMDPKMALRRRAEFTSWQRKMRIATRKWYGLSNARPSAAHTPFTYYYSPYWAGNSGHPLVWRAPYRTPVVVESMDDYMGN